MARLSGSLIGYVLLFPRNPRRRESTRPSSPAALGSGGADGGPHGGLYFGGSYLGGLNCGGLYVGGLLLGGALLGGVKLGGTFDGGRKLGGLFRGGAADGSPAL